MTDRNDRHSHDPAHDTLHELLGEHDAEHDTDTGADGPILEQNIAALLRRAHRPPRIADEARARILERLREHATQHRAAAPADAPHRAAPGDAARAAAAPLDGDRVALGDRSRDAAPGDAPGRAPRSRRAPRPRHSHAAPGGAWRPGVLGLVAALLLTVLLAWWTRPDAPRAPDERARELAEHGADELHDERAAAGRDDTAGERDAEVALRAEPDPNRRQLADGSTVLLDRDARLEQLGPRRLRIERGRAIVDVVPGGGRFVVETPHGEVAVLGTRFALEVDAEATRTAVLRGRVEVGNARGEVALGAGQEAVLRDDAPPVRTPAPRLSHLTSWSREQAQVTARDAAAPAPIRRGNLLARVPNWQTQEYPLPMRELVVDVHLEDEMARVTVDQTFFNATELQLEGVYSFALPPDAAVSRLAMYVDGRLMEAGIVERQRGREVYEGIVYRRRDPALLEWMQGNVVSVRIFPLPPRTEKRILLSYTQALERLYDTVRLEVPIPTVDDPVDATRVHVRLVGGAGLEVASSSHPTLAQRAEGKDLVLELETLDAPLGDDLVLSVRDPMPAGSVRLAELADAEAGARFLMARVQPDAGAPLAAASSEPRPRRWVVLYDTSASRSGIDLAAQRFLVERFLAHADEADLVQLVAFDTTTRVMPGGFRRVDATDAAAVADFLERQGRDRVGSTDLGAALTLASALLREAGASGDHDDHVLYLGDGIATEVGADGRPLEAPALAAELLPDTRFVGVAVGEQVEARLLGGLAERSGGLFATMNPGEDLDWRMFDLVATLATPRVLGLRATLLDEAGTALPEPDAAAYLSRAMLADGEAVSLVARLALDAPRPAALELHGTLDGQPWSRRFALPAVADNAEAGYLPRHWARQRIAALVADALDVHEAEVTRLGLEHFLLTPFTSLLVLENEAMYAQYRVERTREARWAHYDAPETIEVVYEPPLSRTTLAHLSPAALVLRRRLPIFSNGLEALGGFDANAQQLAFGFRSTDAEAFNRLDATVPIAPQGAGQALYFDVPKAELKKKGGRGLDDSNRKELARQLGAVSSSSTLAPLSQSLDSLSADPFAANLAQGQTALGGGGIGYWPAYQPATPSPLAFHYAWDTRLDDVTEWVPALFADPLDQAAIELGLESPARAGVVDPAARRRIEEARAAVAGLHLVAADGGAARLDLRIATSGAGFTLRRQLATGLVEQLEHDGARLVSRYDELGLAVERELGALSPWLLWREVPLVVPAADDLAVHFDVTLDDATLVLTALAGAQRIELELDAQHRPVAIATRDTDGVRHERATLTWHDGGGVTVAHAGGEALALVPGGDEAVAAAESAASDALVRVTMPLRTPEHWSEQVAQLAAGSPQWRAAQVQWLAATLATSSPAELVPIVDALLRESGSLRRGEAALASAAVRWLPGVTQDAVIAGLGAGDPLVRLWRAARTTTSGAPLVAGRGKPDSLADMLIAHRVALAEIPESRRAARAAIERGARIWPRSPLLLVQVQLFSQRWTWEAPDDARALWSLLADDPEHAPCAALEQARTYYNAGKYAEAADVLEAKLLPHLIAGHPGAVIDYVVPQAFQYSGRGPQAWPMFYARWSRAVLAAPTPRSVLTLLDAATLGGDASAVPRILGQLPDAIRSDREFAVSAALLALRGGRAELASALLEPHLPDGAVGASDAPMLALAAQVAHSGGRLERAIELLERRLEALEGEAMALSTLRADYATLLELYQRVLTATFEPDARSALLERALGLAARWRDEDPDNAEIDRRCASLLGQVGESDEAWRHLSSIIERAPFEGASFGAVAEVLAAEGELERAQALWTRAIALEPTDPTWTLARARNQLARGDVGAARADLRAIVDAEWHERFVNVEAEAQRLLAGLGKGP